MMKLVSFFNDINSRLINCKQCEFYLLPKIPKERMPGHTIVSAIGHLTEKYLKL